MNNVLKRLNYAALVPVVVIDDVDKAVSTAESLLLGGLDVMEITLRTKQAIDTIKAVKKAFPEMLVGAGTVLSVDKAKEAIHAGAEFIVAPGLNPNLVSWCVENFIPVTPGCVTPTEIEQALIYGLEVLKFFPAGLYGGINGCKALHGPYRMVSFIPTGGVSLQNLHEYVDKDYIHAIGGSWLCPSSAIKAGDFDSITRAVKSSVEILLGFDPLAATDEVTTHNIDRAVYYMKRYGYVVKTIFDSGRSVIMTKKGVEQPLQITKK